MDRAEAKALPIVADARAGFIGVGEERELGEEFSGGGELFGVGLELVNVLKAGEVFCVVELDVIAVEKLEDGLDLLGGAIFEVGALECDVESVPALKRGEGSRCGRHLIKGLALGEGFPEALGGFIADAGHHFSDATEGDLIVAVDAELEEGGDVFDVHLFKESKAAGDLEGDAGAGELKLDLHGVEVGAIEDGNFVPRLALLVSFKEHLDDVEGLLLGVACGDDQRPLTVGAMGAEFFFKLMTVVSDGGIGNGENLGGAAVVGADSDFAGFRIAIEEGEDIFEVGTAPGVDGLGVVADDHDLAMGGGEGIDEVGLDFVGVLVFIDEDVLEFDLVAFEEGAIGVEKPESLNEEIIVIEGVEFLFLGLKELEDGLDFGGVGGEVGKIVFEKFRERAAFIEAETADFNEELRFGSVFVIPAKFFEAGLHELFRIIAVEDGVVGVVA